MLSHFFLWHVVTVTTTKSGEKKSLAPVNLLVGHRKLMSRFVLWSRRDKCRGGGVLQNLQPQCEAVTCSKNGQNLQKVPGSIWADTASQLLFSI